MANKHDKIFRQKPPILQLMKKLNWSTWPTDSHIVSGSDHCFHTCRLSVRPHFSKSRKQNKISSENNVHYWLRGSLMTPVLIPFLFQNDRVTFFFIFGLCHIVAMSSSFSNPIMYGWLNTSLRSELETLLPNCCRNNRWLSLKFCGPWSIGIFFF